MNNTNNTNLLQSCKRPCTTCILNFWNDADTCIVDSPTFAQRIDKADELSNEYVDEFGVPPIDEWHIFDETAARIYPCHLHKTYDEYECWCKNEVVTCAK